MGIFSAGGLFGEGGAGTAALGTLTSVAGIASAGASLFGGGGGITQGAKAKPFKGLITTPGFRFGAGTLVRRPSTQNLIGQARRIGGLLETQREQIRPGFGRLTAAAVQTVRNRGSAAVGNLRESLSRRNILGASFAQDAITRTRLDFAQEEERVRAEAFVAEIGLELQNIQTQFNVNQAQLAEEFRELQLASQFLANVDQKKLKDLSKAASVEQSLLLMDARDTAQFLDGEQLEAIQNLKNFVHEAGFDVGGDGDFNTGFGEGVTPSGMSIDDFNTGFGDLLRSALESVTPNDIFDTFPTIGSILGGPIGFGVGLIAEEIGRELFGFNNPFGLNIDPLGFGLDPVLGGLDLSAPNPFGDAGSGTGAFGQEGDFGFDEPDALESFDESFDDIGAEDDPDDPDGPGAGQGDPSGEPGEPDE